MNGAKYNSVDVNTAYANLNRLRNDLFPAAKLVRKSNGAGLESRLEHFKEILIRADEFLNYYKKVVPEENQKKDSKFIGKISYEAECIAKVVFK